MSTLASSLPWGSPGCQETSLHLFYGYLGVTDSNCQSAVDTTQLLFPLPRWENEGPERGVHLTQPGTSVDTNSPPYVFQCGCSPACPPVHIRPASPGTVSWAGMEQGLKEMGEPSLRRCPACFFRPTRLLPSWLSSPPTRREGRALP